MQNLGIDVIFNSQTLGRLISGLLLNLEVSFFSIFLSVVLGIFLGMLFSLNKWWIKIPCQLYLNIIRIMPTLVLLFLLYFTLPELLNIDINSIIVGILAFTLWGCAEASDIVRSALDSLPRHQQESAIALGLSMRQVFFKILFPQAIKRTIAPLINLSVRIIMTSSLLVLIGVREVVKVGKEIIEINSFTNTNTAFWIYALILILFFCICYPLSKISKRIESKF